VNLKRTEKIEVRTEEILSFVWFMTFEIFCILDLCHKWEEGFRTWNWVLRVQRQLQKCFTGS